MKREIDSGFLYVASGARRYTLQALRSAKTLKNKLPHAHITLMTDHIHDLNERSYGVFDQVMVNNGLVSHHFAEKNNWGLNLLKRVKVLKDTPYKKTVLLDSDTIIRSADIGKLFEFLDSDDICLSLATAESSRSAGALNQEIYYTGIIGYSIESDKIQALFAQWVSLFERNMTNLITNKLTSPLIPDGVSTREKQFLLQCCQTALAEILSPSVNTMGVALKVLDTNLWNHHSVQYSKDAIVESNPLIKFPDRIENEYGHLTPFPNTIVNTFLGLSNESRAELEKFVRAKAQPYEPRGVSGHGGLRTMFDIFKDSNIALRELRQTIMDVVMFSSERFYLDRSNYHDERNSKRTDPDKISIAINSWAYILDKGAYLASHQHVGAALSATYYLLVSPEIYDKKRGGMLKIFNPNPAEGFTFRGGQMISNIDIYPSPDQFIMFPSYFWHAVAPVPDGAERIALTFDIRVS